MWRRLDLSQTLSLTIGFGYLHGTKYYPKILKLQGGGVFVEFDTDAGWQVCAWSSDYVCVLE
jgi:hypothetical protein